MDEGYLQMKISENNMEIDKIKNKLNEHERKLSYLVRNVEESKDKITKIYDDTKQALNNFDIKEIKKNLSSNIDYLIEKKTSDFLSQIKKVSKDAVTNYKEIAYKEATEIYVRLENSSTRYINMIAKTYGEILIELHSAMMEKNILKKPITTVLILHEFDSDIPDIIYAIDFERGKISCQRGKNIVKKWTRKKVIHASSKKERIQSVKIKPKHNDRVINI